MGLPLLLANYRIMCRISNTDEAAARAKELRGGFVKPEADNRS